MKNKVILSLSGVLLLSSGWLGWGGIPVLVGLVPLLIISGSYGRTRGDFWKTFAWVALTLGLWSALTTWWIAYAHWSGAALSAAINIVLFGSLFMLYHYVSKRAPAPLAYTLLVAGWIACEYLYTVGQVSFPWLTLGNAFAGNVQLVQWYDATGVFGGSLWVLLVNVLLYNALVTRRPVSWIAPVVALLLPATISVVRYHNYREPAEKIVVHAVQPNFNPYTEKFSANRDSQVDIMLDLVREAPADVDYIILPETAIGGDIVEERIDGDPTVERFREVIAERYPRARMILGASTQRIYRAGDPVTETAREGWGGSYYYDYYNSAIALDSSGVEGIYHKYNLLVGVERMPYYNLIKKVGLLNDLIIDMGGISGQLGYGTPGEVFGDGGYLCGPSICWDGVYGEYMTRFVQNGAQVLFIISNDGWWEDTRGYKQLFQFARLRAVETRRAVGRSANTGVTGFINQRGDVLQKTVWDERVAITGELALNDKITFYARYGDYVARISVYLFLLTVLGYVAYRFRRRTLPEK